MEGKSESRSLPTPPLKRHAALIPLSREHMSGLVQARNLLRAAGEDGAARRRAVEAFVREWDAEMREHFEDEERMLLPLTRDATMRARLLREHGSIRAMVESWRRDPTRGSDTGDMRRLGTLLRDHIRWEEREYFEAVQRDHPKAMAELEREASAIEARRPCSRARSTLAWHEVREGREEDRP